MEKDENRTVDDALHAAANLAHEEAQAGQTRLLKLRSALDSGAITVEQFGEQLAEEATRLRKLEGDAEVIGAVAGVDLDLLHARQDRADDDH